MSSASVTSMLMDPSVLIGVVCVLLSVIAVMMLTRRPKADGQAYPYIVGLAFGNPPHRCTQEEALEVITKSIGTEALRPALERIYGNSRISGRYMAVPDFGKNQVTKQDPLFYPTEGNFKVPVEKRFEKFMEKGVPFMTEIARRAIKDAGLQPSDISKMTIATSTGVVGYGVDTAIMQALGLRRSLDRTSIGQMGCAAGIIGLRNSMEFVKANPGQYALFIAVELSSLHVTVEENITSAISHALFADGCAVAVLRAVPMGQHPKGTLAIVDNASWLMEDTEDGITLGITTNGLVCALSKYLPQYISKHIGPFTDRLLSRNGATREDVDFWSCHPGGRRIVEEAAKGLDLTEEDLADSWAVLHEYGNMLSPTVLFVLNRAFKRHEAQRAEGKEGYNLGMAIAFSPGVGAEALLFKQVEA